MKYFFTSLTILLILLSFSPLSSAKYTAVDGDSLVRGEERIRLKGIDAPELHQKCYDENAKTYECGQQSFEFLQDLINKQKVRCKCQKKRDRYKRKLCECFVSTLSLNREMIASGWAVSYKSKKFEEEETEAKKHKYGIWRGKFMRPAIYRSLERANTPKKSNHRKYYN